MLAPGLRRRGPGAVAVPIETAGRAPSGGALAGGPLPGVRQGEPRGAHTHAHSHTAGRGVGVCTYAAHTHTHTRLACRRVHVHVLRARTHTHTHIRAHIQTHTSSDDLRPQVPHHKVGRKGSES